MEHLPLPSGARHFITAPYEAPEGTWYKNEGFLAFPAQHGWSEENLRGGDDLCREDRDDPEGFYQHSKKKLENVERFFQTWLFFGLAIDVLAVGDVKATTETFLKPRGITKARIVDTSSLPALLVRWEANMKRNGASASTFLDLNARFERAAEILDRFCRITDPGEHLPLETNKPRPWPVRDEIATTLIALVSTLRQAALRACGEGTGIDPTSPWPAHARSRILARRLQRKACVADVTTMLKQLPVDGHYFLAASPGLDSEELDHHAECVRAHCLYDYDENMYVTRHTNDKYHLGDSCPDSVEYGGQLGPERGLEGWVDAVHHILDKGAAPIALWVKGLKKLWSVEYHFEGRRRPDYVAISHVWADGKGNPKANELPLCQIERIQRLVEGVRWEGRKPIPSNPNESDGIGFWMDTLCLPATDKRRKGLAIESMRHVYSHAKAVLVLDEWIEKIPSDTSPLELIARIYTSNWLKRLWTHQEGFLPSALWFQFADRAVEIKDLSERLMAHHEALQRQGRYFGWMLSANAQLTAVYAILPETFKSITPETRWTTYKLLAMSMSERKTARQEDEILCLATIIGMPLKEFVQISEEKEGETARLRMQRFLERLGKFDSGIVFNNYPRLQSQGYRWAPRSLLNLRTADLAPHEPNWSNPDAPFEHYSGSDRTGLRVRFHGFTISFPRDGNHSFSSAERGCAIRCEDVGDSWFDVQGWWFVVQLPPNDVEWETNRLYAVILSRVPDPTAKGQRVPAAVALARSAVTGRYTVAHETIATVWIQETAPEWVDTFEESLLPSSTEWFVT
ncbi:hypothetical protein HK57_00512 [Aspergillus ustus]|uniref:Heterokaryon incompatibility domain-containing protein n=1 Tax=Aspergillus ustus TaxID=40382 RepID=A0A0C1BVZ1_ASPUT|nr:hypothetical protein HK57_00512 [Aspergillus ustus]